MPNTYGLPLAVLGPIFLIVLVSLLVIRRRSAGVQSQLERYAAATPSSAGSQLPPEVQAIYNEAKARATALPRDAQAIALDYRQHVAEPYRENLVRLVFVTAGLAQSMDPREAIRYAATMWAHLPPMADQSQSLAS